MPEKRWTAENSEGYAAPAALAVDIVVLTVQAGELDVLLVQRPEGVLALPGGFVGQKEAAAEAAARKLAEKTGLRRAYLEQLETFTDPNRDPRGWIPTVAYLALVPPTTEPDDPRARWTNANAPPALPYGHGKIVEVALDRVAGKLWWSNIASGILAEPFTLSAARSVYEAIAGAPYDASTFARDIRATGLIRPTGKQRRLSVGRPAALYEFAAFDPTWGFGRKKRVRSSR